MPPKDPIKYALWVERQRQAHLGKSWGSHTADTKKVLSEKQLGILEGPPTPNQLSYWATLNNKPRPDISAALTGNPNVGRTVRLRYDAKGRVDERDSPYFFEWRELVLKLFNYACAYCGITEKEYKERQLHARNIRIRGLAAHHIKDWDNYPKLRFVVNNGLALCDNCHAKEEKQIQKENKFQAYLTTRLTSEVPLEDLVGTQAIVYFKETAV